MPPLSPGSSPRPRSLPPVIPPPRRYNRGGLYLAIVIAAACIPLTLKFQATHSPDMSTRRWQMLNLQGVTATQAIKRYGPPTVTHDYSLENGSFAGPERGLKHFYRLNSPELAAHLNDPVVWSYPNYSVIREMIWKLPDSYLTMWLHEPRAVINLDSDNSEVLMPKGSGEWVALDNYRVGNALLKTEPALK